MSGVSRVLRTGRSHHSDHTPSSSLSFGSRQPLSLPTSTRRVTKMASPVVSGQGSKKPLSASHQQTAVIAPEEEEVKKLTGINELSSAVWKLLGLGLQLQSHAARRAKRHVNWTLRAEIIVERGVVGCRSFPMIAVAGSLIGSILCFVEGCFFVLESFLEFFIAVTQMLDRGGVIQHLLQAIDMFLMGTALLTFGMGIYVMFIESTETQQRRSQIAESDIFGLFNLKRLSESMQIQSVSQAKSRIGHAVLLILQTGMVEKFRSVPLTSGLDLACFAGALLTTSATVFLLSRVTAQNTKVHFGRNMNK